ncbi:imidazole glycerol phosphate synthase subunit HisH [Halodesulfurarchaeum sp.]|uniref:imidazole glycerol phosphate synthase subunit HisH n=1 Tax=Halodesulfurarchaeum sp. TaxID=1980530 RepID=UPI001BBB8450|nr:imidazole glycerol phosphate synthase subunit HisH [Halodesulfurarchaeum sp.]
MDTSRGTQPPEAEVVVLDYGLGNLRSVTRGLERAGAAVRIEDDPEAIWAADGVILPGVGAFGDGMENAGPFREDLLEAAAVGRPILGICLGMQMLLTSSEEADRAGQGDVQGLDLVPGRNVKFRGDLKIPHMGWNQLDLTRSHPVIEGIDGEYAYFVHSYYADPEDSDSILARSDYGVEFPAVITNEGQNVIGTQFHPEKSGETGLRLLRNFVDFVAD